jgi:hypothetical protein
MAHTVHLSSSGGHTRQLMSDPEIMAAMQNPKFMAAMQNPASAMNDPGACAP